MFRKLCCSTRAKKFRKRTTASLRLPNPNVVFFFTRTRRSSWREMQEGSSNLLKRDSAKGRKQLLKKKKKKKSGENSTEGPAQTTMRRSTCHSDHRRFDKRWGTRSPAGLRRLLPTPIPPLSPLPCEGRHSPKREGTTLSPRLCPSVFGEAERGGSSSRAPRRAPSHVCVCAGGGGGGANPEEPTRARAQAAETHQGRVPSAAAAYPRFRPVLI